MTPMLSDWVLRFLDLTLTLFENSILCVRFFIENSLICIRFNTEKPSDLSTPEHAHADFDAYVEMEQTMYPRPYFKLAQAG